MHCVCSEKGRRLRLHLYPRIPVYRSSERAQTRKRLSARRKSVTACTLGCSGGPGEHQCAPDDIWASMTLNGEPLGEPVPHYARAHGRGDKRTKPPAVFVHVSRTRDIRRSGLSAPGFFADVGSTCQYNMSCGRNTGHALASSSSQLPGMNVEGQTHGYRISSGSACESNLYSLYLAPHSLPLNGTGGSIASPRP